MLSARSWGVEKLGMSQKSAESRGSTLGMSHWKQLTTGRIPFPCITEVSQEEGKNSEKGVWGRRDKLEENASTLH